MTKSPNSISKYNLKCLLRGVADAGISVGLIKLGRDGAIIIVPSTNGVSLDENELDRELAEFEARHGEN